MPEAKDDQSELCNCGGYINGSSLREHPNSTIDVRFAMHDLATWANSRSHVHYTITYIVIKVG